jgi:sec-independent protein translocase protein TatC
MKNPNELNLSEHLDELRSRLIQTIVTFLVWMLISFVFVKDIYEVLVSNMDRKLIILGPTDVMWVFFMIAGIMSLTLTIPVATYHVWRFVQPAVSLSTQKATMNYIPALTIIFILGISFGYFILFPIMLKFLNKISADTFEMMYTAQKYFTFMIHMTLPFGLLFEMPVVVMFLTKLGILNPNRIIKARKISYFILVVVAVTITPPDILSDILVILPLFLLYEVSLTISKMVYRKQQLENQSKKNQAI